MRRFCAQVLFPSFLTAAVVSCGLYPLAGGSGTETVNTYAVLADGSPARGAAVRIIYPECWLDSISQKSSPVVLRAVANDRGRFSLAPPERNRQCNIQIDHSGQGLFLQSFTAAQIDGDTLFLEPYASYTGSFAESGLDINQMYLSGSAYQASIGSDGNFFFSNVAAGTYTLVGVSGAPSPYRVTICGAITLLTNATSADSALNPAFNRLLVDNFESGFGPTSLGGIAPELWWYTVSDSGMYYWKRSSNSWKWILYGGHTCTSLHPVAGENGGIAGQFSAVLDSTVLKPMPTAGIFLNDLNENGLDLSAMTAFSMRARGTGTIRIRFETATLDSISSFISAYSYPLALTDTWRDYAIPVDSLRILDPVYFPSLYPWSKESKNVLRIEFEFSAKENAVRDTLIFEFDDLFLEGVGVEILQR